MWRFSSCGSPAPTVEVTKQVVVDIELFRSNEKLGKQFTVKWLQCWTNHSKTGISEYLVRKTFQKYRSLNKKQKSDPEQLKSFLNQAFLAVCVMAPLQGILHLGIQTKNLKKPVPVTKT